jgi:hypothetical protein
MGTVLKFPKGVETLTRTITGRKSSTNSPAVITIEAAERCCKNTAHVLTSELLGYANSLVRALFELPPPRTAGFALRLEVPTSFISLFTTVGKAGNIIPVEFTPPPPLRYILPAVGDPTGQSYFETDIPEQPEFGTFTANLTSIALALQTLAARKSKQCFEFNGLPRNNPRVWSDRSGQTRKT